MMRCLPEGGLGGIRLQISTEFWVDLSFLAAGVARDYDENTFDGPNFVNNSQRATRTARTRKHSEQTSMKKLGEATGKWSRYAVAPPWMASANIFAMCALRPALCGNLDRAAASMCLPRASPGGECCFAVAVLGDQRGTWRFASGTARTTRDK